MWHVLHLIARPIEALLGVFCVVTAIMLYPSEEGKIQSKFEDFWVRVDDFQRTTLSNHTTFLQQVARLESSWLDRLFGHKLLSARSVAVSLVLSFSSAATVASAMSLQDDHSEVALFLFLLSILCYLLGPLMLLYPLVRFPEGPHVKPLSFTVIVIVVGLIILQRSLVFVVVSVICISCDFLFISLTRRLLHLAGTMTKSTTIALVVVLNCSLAALLCVLPIFFSARIDQMLYIRFIEPSHGESNSAILAREIMAVNNNITLIATSNSIDAVIACLFGLLAVTLLVHRALWPLLTRTLFRMTDIGTKGRRAILTTVGLALLAAGISGKVPELVQKLIEKFGG
jgi:hypothetical protein